MARGRKKKHSSASTSTKALRLSLCMIVKNEERYLEECLGSVQGVVDEVVMVDTGSTDRTIAIAEHWGAKIFHIDWTGDFSAARNEALQHCTGEWVLQLDADEELRPEDRSTLADLMRHPVADGYVVALRSDMREGETTIPAISRAVRLFRRRPAFRYTGMIHESVMEEILKHGGVVRPAEITLLHKGYAASSEEIQKKKDRNLEVLLRQAGHSPEDFYTVLKLGETHLAMDHLPEAEEAIQRGLGLLNAGKVAARDTARVAQLFILKTLLHSKQKNFRDAEIAAQQSLRIAPHQSIAHSLLSHMYEEQGRHSEAIAELRYLLEARSTSKGLSLEADVQSRREELLFRLARLLALSQDRRGAKEALVRSRDANPGYLPTLVSLSGMFVEDGNMAEALSCLDSAIRVSPREPKLHVLHAQVLLSLQRRDEAVDHLQQCFSLGILSEEGLTLLVKLLAESTSQIDAIPYLRRLTELRPSAVDVRFSLVQGLIAKEHFSEALRELEVALSLSPREPLNGMFVALKSQLEAYLHAHASGSM